MTIYIRKFLIDVASETPKVYNWICGIAASIGFSAGAIVATYDKLPVKFQILPESVLTGITVAALLGALVSKKQNPKTPTE